MLGLTIPAVIGVLITAIAAWFKWQAHRAEKQAVEFARKNAKLEAEKAELKTQNAVAKTQIKNYQTRTKNEAITRTDDRDALLERMQANADLRD